MTDTTTDRTDDLVADDVLSRMPTSMPSRIRPPTTSCRGCPPTTTSRGRRGRRRRRRRRPDARRSTAGTDDVDDDVERRDRSDATDADDADDRRRSRRRGRRPLDPSRVVVRRAHAVGLREEGHRQPACSHPEHEHGRQDLRGRHPHGGGRRVQERSQADRAAEGLPRLPARALRDGRRVLVLHPQHARRHRLRRPEPPGPEAHAAVAPRGGARSWRQGRRRRAVGPHRSRSSTTTSARASGSRKARSPTSPARSPRSTPIT